MATSATPEQAFIYANYMTKEMALSTVHNEILDAACSRLWNAAAWPWTIGYLQTITLSSSAVNYSTSFPSDFANIYKAVLYDSDKVYKPLAIDPELPANPGRTGQTITVAPAGTSAVRIYPAPPASLPSPAQQILLWYKKNPPKITSANCTSACLVMDDRWFHVYKSAVLIEAYKYADDARGFDITTDNTGKQTKMGGELAYFTYLVGEMKECENFPYEWDVYAESRGETR